MLKHIETSGNPVSGTENKKSRISLAGGTPLVVTRNGKAYRGHSLKGHRERRYQRAFYPDPEDGNQDRHDNR